MKKFQVEKELKNTRKINKKQLIVSLSLLMLFAVIGISFALFKLEIKEYVVFNGKVGEFNASDVKFAVLVDGKTQDAFPTKDSGYIFESITCENGSTGTWNEAEWNINITISGPDTCEISFVTKAPTLVEHVESLLVYNQTTMKNDDPGKNVRYIGINPDNYVYYNNELWRIIGVFSVQPSSTGAAEKRVKLVKSTPIDTALSWDTSPTSQTATEGKGINAWHQADIMTLLNGIYINRTSGACYNDMNNAYKTCNFATTGLSVAAQNLISQVYWTTGSVAAYDTTENGLVNHFYNNERGTTVNTTSSDGVIRQARWQGLVGMIFPSDYGYSIAGNETVNRETCLSYPINKWDDAGYTTCGTDSYLYSSEYDIWTMTVVSVTRLNTFAVSSSDGGRIGAYNAYRAKAVKPVVYLKADVQMLDGKGTSDNPYKIGYQ